MDFQEMNNDILNRLSYLEKQVKNLECQLNVIKKYSTSERLHNYLEKTEKLQKLSKLVTDLSEEKTDSLVDRLQTEDENILINIFGAEAKMSIPKTYQEAKQCSETLDDELSDLEDRIDKEIGKENWDDYFEYEVIEDEIKIKKYIGFNEPSVIVPKKINGVPVICIGVKCFENCEETTSIKLPDSIKTFERWAFHNCGITQILLPSNLEYIGEQAFENSRLSSVEIPDKVSVIGSSAFKDCKFLRKVILSKNLKIIESHAFASTNITHINIPQGVRSIGACPFSDCYDLKHICIPKSVVEFKGSGLRNYGLGSSNSITIYCEPGSAAIKQARENNYKIDKYENYREA